MIATPAMFNGTTQPSFTYGTAETFSQGQEYSIEYATGITVDPLMLCPRCFTYTGGGHCDECWEAVCREARLRELAGVAEAARRHNTLLYEVRRRQRREPLPVKKKVFKHHYSRGRM
jgi:hypothetical protein